ncbi:MAG: preprotein translocase subunit SecE [Planctomycetes bacterium]|nr:preprotein translocase subunit SecE [Planctomycetota bacterium]MCB9917295.1 preprotein translocase subunit SecE [Planctomycetota bacterium]
MAYKPAQGRLARMAAFWLLWLLVVYGCSSFRHVVDGWTGPGMKEKLFAVPLLGDVTYNVILTLIVLPAIAAFVIYRIFSRPKTADYLIDVEDELRKVHWPTFPEARGASFVVIIFVLILMGYLAGGDWLLGRFFNVVWSWGMPA